ncbi:hypothetical protein [Sphingobacterium suaedae]|uniref:Uncharacterized protein n=1 Tax=Sphingobacterium suaedae TaxID=1686402 RepID=A0ABW5KBL4_9SPHI
MAVEKVYALDVLSFETVSRSVKSWPQKAKIWERTHLTEVILVSADTWGIDDHRLTFNPAGPANGDEQTLIC